MDGILDHYEPSLTLYKILSCQVMEARRIDVCNLKVLFLGFNKYTAPYTNLGFT